MPEININWQPYDITITASLTLDENPHLTHLLWSTLPYRSLQNHALVSGCHLYHLVPDQRLVFTEAAHKEDRTLRADGTLFLSQLQHLAIKYGPLTEYLPAAAIGHVHPQSMDALREAGRLCWGATYDTKDPVEVRVTRANTAHETDTAFSLPKPIQLGTPDIRALIADVHNETERIWTSPPQEVLDIHEGRSPSYAGSYAQYFSTLVFCNGETRPLGYCSLNGLLRLAQDPTITIDTLRRITPEFVTVPTEFLDYCGLKKLRSFTRRALSLLKQVTTRDEYAALMSTLALYVNCLNTWNLHYFPWRHGNEYPYPNP